MTAERTIVEQEVYIDAEPEAVFPFLLEPELMIRWMGRTAEIEARPGGAIRCEMNDRDAFSGEIVEIEAPLRVVFTFGWEAEDSPIPPGSTTVEVTLTAEAGGTRVRLVHRDVPALAADIHAQGWRLYLDRLAVAAAGGDPGPDPNAQPGNM